MSKSGTFLENWLPQTNAVRLEEHSPVPRARNRVIIPGTGLAL